LVVFIEYILTDCCIITCIHIFSSSAASVINKFIVQCSVCDAGHCSTQGRCRGWKLYQRVPSI